MKLKIETNELSRNAMGGTELMLDALYSNVDSDLLEHFQIIPSRVRELDESKKKILWLHDLPNDPESKHLGDKVMRDRFDGLVCVSNWQMQMYNLILGLPYSDATVLKNAIVPIDIDKKEFDGTINIIYHTTPHRGLELLIPVFEHLQEMFPIHLDVYSSFNIYGWPERDKQYEKLFDACRKNENITYHGSVPNSEVREALKKSHIFAYPSIWPETSCIAAIEAMSAMNIVVCPNYAALPETCNEWAMMYQWSEDHTIHANRFAEVLAHACKMCMEEKMRDHMTTHLEYQKRYYDMFYSWDFRKLQWENYLTKLI